MIVLYILGFLLSVVGLTEIISCFICRLNACKGTYKEVLFIKIKDKNGYDFAVNTIIEFSKWNNNYPMNIVFICDELSDDMIDNICRMTDGYPYMRIATKETAINMVNEL